MDKGNVSAERTDDALYLIISALGDNLLRTIQNCSTESEAWDRLQARYIRETLINNLGVFNSLLNFKLNRKEQMANHIESMETTCSRLAALKDLVSESMQVAIQHFSLSNPPQYPSITASICTTKENEAS